MILKERQHDEQSLLFNNLDNLIQDVASHGYENVHLIGGQTAGLLGITKDLVNKDKLVSAKSYYWRILLNGYKFFEIYKLNSKKNIKPNSGQFTVIKRNMSYVIEAENSLAQLIFESGATPDNEKVWGRLEYILETGIKICEIFQPEAKPKKINNLSIVRTSTALHISEANPSGAISILKSQISALSDVYHNFIVDTNDSDSVSQPADHLNNIGSMYTHIATLYQIEANDSEFLENLINSQLAFKESIRILTETEFVDHYKFKIRKAAASSNLAFTYVLLGHHYIDFGGNIYQINECIKQFKEHFDSAGGEFMALPTSKEVTKFDAESYRRTADILILLLAARLKTEISIDFTQHEWEILQYIIKEEDYSNYVFDPINWLIEKITSYLEFSTDLTKEHDDKMLLLQTTKRFGALL